jgi:hypothetical protein
MREKYTMCSAVETKQLTCNAFSDSTVFLSDTALIFSARCAFPAVWVVPDRVLRPVEDRISQLIHEQERKERAKLC